MASESFLNDGLGQTLRTAPLWGTALTEADYAALAESWITPQLATEAMLRRVNSIDGQAISMQKGSHDCAGILFPMYWPGTLQPHAYRIRRDNPETTQGKDGKVKPERKYIAPQGCGNRLYIPPGVTLEQLDDATIPLVITEGEKKGLALQRLAHHNVETPRFIPIAIPGVWNWLGTTGKTGGPKGERVDIKGPINDLNRIKWEGRTVFVLFDSNVATNESVEWARKKLTRELVSRKATVRWINLPEEPGVNGVDDLLALKGPEPVLRLFEESAPGAVLQVVPPPQFRSGPDGMFRVRPRGEELVRTQLANYNARIITNIRLDDGVDAKQEFELVSELLGRSYRFTIPASRFTSMEWPLEQLGPQAITFPTQRDYARAAIQSASLDAEERCVYTHSGWRIISGRWAFLHAGGAIDGAGVVPGINVRLPSALSRYELGAPSTPQSLSESVRSSLRLLDLLPAAIAYPVLAAVFRSVFGGADLALHVVGETGAFKSELAALAQQFFGAEMDRTHLPGSWASTANSLEVLAFHAKDVLVVIDDFAPSGNTADIARYHAAAERVFRSAGNQSGRGRLDSNAQLREPKSPRGLILSTGEDVPRGQSVRARLLILELSKGDISKSALTECQVAARGGDYAQAMSGFIMWMAPQLDGLRAAFVKRTEELRFQAVNNPAHARTPDIVANLVAAFEFYVDFCVECGAIDATQGERLKKDCWQALSIAANAQSKHQAVSEPASRFMELIRSCLSSGQAHLTGRCGSYPVVSPEDCGWRPDARAEWSSQGLRIGWAQDDDIFLEPAAAYQVAQTVSRESGDQLAVTLQTLKKRLQEKGLLASTDERRETLTVRRKLGGSQKHVLHILRSTLLPTGETEIGE